MQRFSYSSLNKIWNVNKWHKCWTANFISSEGTTDLKETEIVMIVNTKTKASLLSAIIQEHTANLVIIWSVHAENKLQSKEGMFISWYWMLAQNAVVPVSEFSNVISSQIEIKFWIKLKCIIT